jgi:protein disulfide-isomerase-like protein
MFYAPWCGHCKAAKPHFNDAAAMFANEPKVGIAAVDCTTNEPLCAEFDVQGFPTIMHFTYGKNQRSYTGGRTKEAFIDALMRELGPDFKPDNMPAYTPPKEKEAEAWSEPVKSLTPETFDVIVKASPNAIIGFVAPWCGHCKAARPAFEEAAMKVSKTNKDRLYATVDCSMYADFCTSNEVQGFPTFLLYKNGVKQGKHSGGRTVEGFVAAFDGKTEL